MLRAVIFDIDGTLVDSVDLHAQCWKEAFEHFGYDIPYGEIRYQIGKGGDKLLAMFLSEKEIEKRGHQIEEFRGELFQRKYFPRCKPFPKVLELFERLRDEGLKLALASSGKKDEVRKYEQLLGIETLIDASTSSDDAEKSKPDPDILQEARKKIGNVEPAECLYVGDSPHDAKAARRDGMPMVGVLCGGFSKKDLLAEGALRTYQDPADLLAEWGEEKIRAAG
jgi:HAD superfamily hydrolase (TIGR01549 family)